MPRKSPKSFRVGRITVRRMDGTNRRGRWRAEWYPPGGGGRLKTRSLGWSSRLMAERAAAALLAEGMLDEAPRTTLGGEIRTVQQVLEAYGGSQQARADLAPASRLATIGALTRLAQHIGELPVGAIGRTASATYRDRYLTRTGGTGSSTAALDLTVLRAAVRYLQQCGLQIPSPVRVNIMVSPTYSRHTPSPADVAAVLPHLLTPWHRAAVCLLWGTGARIGDLQALSWADVAKDAIIIPQGTKTGRRVVPLTPRARQGLDILREHYPGGDIWPTLQRLSNALHHGLKRACRLAGVPPFSSHGLRRLAVDSMRRAGVPLEVAAAITGHSATTMMRHYRTVNHLELQQALERTRLGEVPRGELVTLDLKRGGGEG
tara:strand:- start:964 stop:2088 length:1125 start_codon:yes stop_codon:yes gene_type:complete